MTTGSQDPASVQDPTTAWMDFEDFKEPQPQIRVLLQQSLMQLASVPCHFFYWVLCLVFSTKRACKWQVEVKCWLEEAKQGQVTTHHGWAVIWSKLGPFGGNGPGLEANRSMEHWTAHPQHLLSATFSFFGSEAPFFFFLSYLGGENPI